MAGSYLGDVRAMSFATVPAGWAPCKGQLLPIAGNEALFGLLGTAYGGDGHTNFALPSLAGIPAGGGAFLNYCLCVQSAPAYVILGEVRAMPFGFAPSGWMTCQGQLLPIGSNTGLFSLLLTTYGGDGQSTFGLPNLPALQAERGTLQYCIAAQGAYPGHPEPEEEAAACAPEEEAATCAPEEAALSQPFVGEIRNFPFNFAPAGWLTCEGQIVPTEELPALFAAIGTTYGGDGTTTFGLPNAAPLESADGSPVSVCISYYGAPPAGG